MVEMKKFLSVYEKSSTYKGISYLHAWNNPPDGFSWVKSHWHNICLRYCDAELPDLQAGQTIAYEGDIVSESGMFVTVMLRGPIILVRP